MAKRKLTEGEKSAAADDYKQRKQAGQPGLIVTNILVEDETDDDGNPKIRHGLAMRERKDRGRR